MAGGGSPVGDIDAALGQLGMSVQSLWIGYFAVGGNGSLADLEGWLGGASDPGDHDYDLLAQAVNDEFTARDLNHPVVYRADR